jgi:hypothetical protein
MTKMQDLVKKPLIITLPDAEYNFHKQTRFHSQLNIKMAVTFRGTQTHNSQGKPNDNDND